MQRSSAYPAVCLAFIVAASCAEPAKDPTAPSFGQAPSGPTVTSTNPSSSVRDTTLVVQVLGSGYDNGSQAEFLLNGAPDPKVVTNSTSFVSSTRLDANITIAADAVPTYRDVAVTTSGGKKGIGTAKFQVLEPILIPLTAGATANEVWDVNSSGVATGWSEIGGVACSHRGLVWSQANGPAMLPMPAGYCTAGGTRISDAGVIVGTANPDGSLYGTLAARWIPNGTFSWSVEVLPRPSPELYMMGNVNGVNGSGSLVDSWAYPDKTSDVWFWSTSTAWVRLARPATATSCSVEGMNDSDEIVGFCSGLTAGGAVYWASPTASPIVLPATGSGMSSKASAINNLHVIGGSYVYTVNKTTYEHVARWRPNGSGGWVMDDLGMNGRATGVSEDGTIVALYNGDAFVVSPSLSVSHLDPLDKVKGIPFAVNANARDSNGILWIVGWAQAGASSGGYRGLVWKR